MAFESGVPNKPSLLGPLIVSIKSIGGGGGGELKRIVETKLIYCR